VSAPPPESPFRQVLHEAPKLSVAERLGTLGLAVIASALLTVLVFVLWWLWITWMPIDDGKDGPIPVLLEVQGAPE
jgi:hypothetical protein